MILGAFDPVPPGLGKSSIQHTLRRFRIVDRFRTSMVHKL
jgi:hypothetical protein